MSNRYTENGLPKITEEVWRVFDRDFTKRNTEGTVQHFYQEIVRTIREEDPQLAKTIDYIVANSQTTQESTAEYMAGFLYAYELLRRQAQTYKLEDNIN